MTTVDEIRETLGRYKELIDGVTFDRGCGTEYFGVLECREKKSTLTTYDPELVLENGDVIDAKFLADCVAVNISICGSITLQEERPTLKALFKESEVQQIARALDKGKQINILRIFNEGLKRGGAFN